jgi:hypothetical protein
MYAKNMSKANAARHARAINHRSTVLAVAKDMVFWWGVERKEDGRTRG